MGTYLSNLLRSYFLKTSWGQCKRNYFLEQFLKKEKSSYLFSVGQRKRRWSVASLSLVACTVNINIDSLLFASYFLVKMHCYRGKRKEFLDFKGDLTFGNLYCHWKHLLGFKNGTWSMPWTNHYSPITIFLHQEFSCQFPFLLGFQKAPLPPMRWVLRIEYGPLRVPSPLFTNGIILHEGIII